MNENLKIKKIDKQISGEYFTESRFIIVDHNDNIVDDAQSYGYKSFESAKKAMWYKFKGGSEKIDNLKKTAINFWKKNKEIAKFATFAIENNIKELAREEITEKDIVKAIKDEFNIMIPVKYLKYLT